jgi:hypothetical protein
MIDYFALRKSIEHDGFAIVEDVFSEAEVNALTAAISEIDTDNPTFRKTKDLFAIRQFLKEVPGVSRLI